MKQPVDNLSSYIFPVSATMVGVCVTVISLMQLIPKSNISPWADGLLAVDSLIFLGSSMLSYWSIRHKDDLLHIEHYADRLFLLGMTLMVFVSFLVAFELFKD